MHRPRLYQNLGGLRRRGRQPRGPCACDEGEREQQREARRDHAEHPLAGPVHVEEEELEQRAEEHEELLEKKEDELRSRKTQVDELLHKLRRPEEERNLLLAERKKLEAELAEAAAVGQQREERGTDQMAALKQAFKADVHSLAGFLQRFAADCVGLRQPIQIYVARGRGEPTYLNEGGGMGGHCPCKIWQSSR